MTEPATALTNGVRLVGETILPGASLLMEGNVKNGTAHVVAALGAKALLGPAGLLLVAADSFSKAVTDKYLWNHVSDVVQSVRAKKETPAVEAPAVAEDTAPAVAQA